VAHQAYDLWAASNSAVAAVPIFKLAHPAAVDRDGTGNDAALKAWAKAITTLRSVVAADPNSCALSRGVQTHCAGVQYGQRDCRKLRIRSVALSASIGAQQGVMTFIGTLLAARRAERIVQLARQQVDAECLRESCVMWGSMKSVHGARPVRLPS
jgi:hypothetical protein